MKVTTSQGLLGPADLRRLAQALDVRPAKSLGQNFVVDANTVRRIARAAALDPAYRCVAPRHLPRCRVGSSDDRE